MTRDSFYQKTYKTCKGKKKKEILKIWESNIQLLESSWENASLLMILVQCKDRLLTHESLWRIQRLHLRLVTFLRSVRGFPRHWAGRGVRPPFGHLWEKPDRNADGTIPALMTTAAFVTWSATSHSWVFFSPCALGRVAGVTFNHLLHGTHSTFRGMSKPLSKWA